MKDESLRLFSRELSWIEFNARVLDEALRADVPLLERLRFLTIVASNFDEFFMVRVAALKVQVQRNPEALDVSGLSAAEHLLRVSSRVHALVNTQFRCLREEILPGLAREGIVYVSPPEYTPTHLRFLDSFFMNEAFPLLTPLRANGSELPSIGNLRLHAAFLLRSSIALPTGPLADFLETSGILSVPDSLEGENPRPPLAIVQIPSSIPRVVWLPQENGIRLYTLLDDVVKSFAQRLFPGFTIDESLLFKVARDADRAVDEERDDDFIAAIQEVIESRLSSVPVRLLCAGESPVILEALKESMGLAEEDVYHVPGPIDLPTLVELVNTEGLDRLRNPHWRNFWPVDLPVEAPLWDELKRTDVLLHVPYQSYEPVIRFINDAADDSSVLAIKMTLYRTSGDSPIIRALERAAHLGKHVTVFVELKARFDEERNIAWVQRLEQAGIIVVYGIARLKVHAKIMLVVRREPEGIRRYVHLSTGNYNDRTARFYVDMSLFTTNEEIANDATAFFNMISGYSAIMNTKRLVMAPVDIKPKLLALIDREIERSSPECPGRIIAKMNSLADPEVISGLYRASRAGVKILLNIRGVCMLVPGVPGLSENVTVVSVIDRFLEHTRIFCFENSGANEIWLSSADWMSRNLDRRVELMFPLLQESIRKKVRDVLQLYFSDNVKAHYLQSDGSWIRREPVPGESPLRIQEALYEAERKRTDLFEKEPQREFIVRRN